MAVLTLAGAGCAKIDMPTACSHRIADMYSVKLDAIAMGDVTRSEDGTSVIGGAVDTGSSEGVRAFECTFDTAGKLEVQVMLGDAE